MVAAVIVSIVGLAESIVWLLMLQYCVHSIVRTSIIVSLFLAVLFWLVSWITRHSKYEVCFPNPMISMRNSSAGSPCEFFVRRISTFLAPWESGGLV